MGFLESLNGTSNAPEPGTGKIVCVWCERGAEGCVGCWSTSCSPISSYIRHEFRCLTGSRACTATTLKLLEAGFK